VYIRKTDGSPAVRLGEGSAQALSPDGKWALAIAHIPADPQLAAYPTGAGEPKTFPRDGLSVLNGVWSPDGKQILFTASEPGRGPRLYLRGVDGGKARALSPEGYVAILVSPDGKSAVVTGPDRKYYLYPIAGGEPTAIPGIEITDGVDQFTADGRFLYVHRREAPLKVYRVELATGRREIWRTLMPSDAAGVSSLSDLPTPSGEAYVYNYVRTLSDLYIVEGLK
jgi:Tol biopolymer transport system component